MKYFYRLILAAFCTIAPFGAIADGVTETTDEVPVLAPAEVNWAGFYGGLSYNAQSSNLRYPNGSSFSLDSDKLAGGFAGYSWQAGSFVYGAELSNILGGLAIVGYPGEELNHIMELRGRGGYAFGNALIYGFLGYSKANMKYSYDSTKLNASGVNYGLGIDYKITSSAFAGIEVSNHNFKVNDPSNGDFDIELDMISFRLGYNY